MVESHYLIAALFHDDGLLTQILTLTIANEDIWRSDGLHFFLKQLFHRDFSISLKVKLCTVTSGCISALLTAGSSPVILINSASSAVYSTCKHVCAFVGMAPSKKKFTTYGYLFVLISNDLQINSICQTSNQQHTRRHGIAAVYCRLSYSFMITSGFQSVCPWAWIHSVQSCFYDTLTNLFT